MMIFWIVLTGIVVVLGYIRLAPSDPATWHEMPADAAERDFGTGVIRIVQVGPDGLDRLDRIILDTPRTSQLAGSAKLGMVTYVTRSKVFGFPDYTTVRQDGETLTIYGRARFGRADFGVNRARVEGWIDALQP